MDSIEELIEIFCTHADDADQSLEIEQTLRDKFALKSIGDVHISDVRAAANTKSKNLLHLNP